MGQERKKRGQLLTRIKGRKKKHGKGAGVTGGPRAGPYGRSVDRFWNAEGGKARKARKERGGLDTRPTSTTCVSKRTNHTRFLHRFRFRLIRETPSTVAAACTGLAEYGYQGLKAYTKSPDAKTLQKSDQRVLGVSQTPRRGRHLDSSRREGAELPPPSVANRERQTTCRVKPRHVPVSLMKEQRQIVCRRRCEGKSGEHHEWD